MTLGLAVGNKDGIYLAIDSLALSAASERSLQSKIHDLQAKPLAVLLTAGGLEHWSDVVSRYRPQSTIKASTSEVMRILDQCMQTQNQAFGLLCAYEDGIPRCYRINRSVGDQSTSIREENISVTQPLGTHAIAFAAAREADSAIQDGRNMLVALVGAIQARIPGPETEGPIQVRMIEP